MGTPEVEELQKHAKNYSSIVRFSILTFKSIISPRITVVIEMTLYIHYVLLIQIVLDIINPVVTSVYE